MDHKIKSYKLSPQLRAELHHSGIKRGSTLNFKAPRIDLSKFPWKKTLRISGVFLLLIAIYFGIKTGYEKAVYAAEQKQIAKEQEYQKQLGELRKQIEQEAQDAFSFVKLSQKYLDERDGQKAEIAALIATEKEPEWRDGFVNLGHIYLSVNKFKEAEAALLRAAELDPINPQTHYLLYLTYQELKDENTAKKEFAKAKQFGLESEIGG